MDFYIPTTKRELVLYLNKRYKGKMTGFSGMKRSQLLAIYINTRKRDEKTC